MDSHALHAIEFAGRILSLRQDADDDHFTLGDVIDNDEREPAQDRTTRRVVEQWIAMRESGDVVECAADLVEEPQPEARHAAVVRFDRPHQVGDGSVVEAVYPRHERAAYEARRANASSHEISVAVPA